MCLNQKRLGNGGQRVFLGAPGSGSWLPATRFIPGAPPIPDARNTLPREVPGKPLPRGSQLPPRRSRIGVGQKEREGDKSSEEDGTSGAWDVQRSDLKGK